MPFSHRRVSRKGRGPSETLGVSGACVSGPWEANPGSGDTLLHKCSGITQYDHTFAFLRDNPLQFAGSQNLVYPRYTVRGEVVQAGWTWFNLFWAARTSGKFVYLSLDNFHVLFL